MDLLGSIMSSMEKPPSLTEKEKLIIKKRKEEIEKRQAAEKERLRQFKEDIENKIKSFFDNPLNTSLKFAPLDHVYRSIIHEVAEIHGFLTYAFGIDGVDRYVRVYRKENAPCEDELAARRRGDPWNEQVKLLLLEKREREKLEKVEEVKRKPEKFVPNSNYKDKYAHLIGHDAALKAARKTETNKSYGFGEYIFLLTHGMRALFPCFCNWHGQILRIILTQHKEIIFCVVDVAAAIFTDQT